VSAGAVRFPGGLAPPRSEWFVAGTAQRLVDEAPAYARRPRITNPVSGSIYAVDPDIPPERQSLGVSVSGELVNLRLALDGRDFAGAGGTPQIPLLPGSHLLSLRDESGRTIDRVRFTVR
jgi:penicillin-binding protein 1C